MLWLTKLVEEGHIIEGIISKQPGFELISLSNPLTKERILYWRRSGEITRQTVEHLQKIVKISVDKLFIEFTDKPQITQEAEQLLKQIFKKVEIRTSRDIKIEDEKTKRLELYNGNITIIKKKFTRGSLRLNDADQVLNYMQYLRDNEMWIIVIERTSDGKVRIYDAYKSTWQDYVKKTLEEGSQVVIFAVWHGQYSTDVFLLYPSPHK